MWEPCGIKEGSLTPLMEEDGMRTTNSSQPTLRWHLSTPPLFYQWLLGSPWWCLALAYVQDIITPRVWKISLTFNLKSWLPPEESCSEPELGECKSSAPQEMECCKKTFKFDGCWGSVGWFLLRAGIASPVLSDFNADIADIRNLTEQQTLASSVLSDRLATSPKLIKCLHLELNVLKQ